MSTIVVYEDLMEITNQGNEDAQEELGRALKTASDFKYALDEHAIVAITDADGTISYVNDRFCDISGFSESELMGQTHRIINSSYHTKEFFNDLRTTIAGGSVWRGEIRNKRKDGSIFWVDMTVVPFFEERKPPEQFIAISADITDRKLYEEQLKEMTRELDRKNRELQSMIYAASHDLRSPLVNVQGFAAMLGKHVGGLKEVIENAVDVDSRFRDTIYEIGKEIDLALGFVNAGAIKMDGLLNGLLSVSRMGNSPLMIQDLDVNAIVRSSLDAMKFQIVKSRANFITHDLPMVRGDRQLLGRVFTNLFENALKSHSLTRQLSLEICGELKGTTAVIRVRDNGVGMTEQCRKRIFDLFFQIESTNSEGNGIGLTIVKTALERMNGSISVSSEHGVGSVFTLTLPSCTP